MVMDPSIKTVDQYIATYPEATQVILKRIRSVIHTAAPNATEKISYGIPTYWSGRNVIHFGGYGTHIGLYPGAQAIVDFQAELKDYETSKGTIRFPLDKPIPYDLIEKIALYCVERSTKKK